MPGPPPITPRVPQLPLWASVGRAANRAGRCWRSMAGREEEVGVSMR
ncbi:Uncharacterised protein [Bordetella pertussis]|nr:Uncharacterised protein [Bordetella pertussis]